MKRLDKFDSIYKEALRYRCFHDDDVSYYFASGDNEITIILHDTTRVFYTAGDKGCRYSRPGSDQNDTGWDNEETWRHSFANKLRKEMWCSRVRLAELTGISERTISKYLSEKATPSAYNIRKIARALGCSPSVLIDGIDLKGE